MLRISLSNSELIPSTVPSRSGLNFYSTVPEVLLVFHRAGLLLLVGHGTSHHLGVAGLADPTETPREGQG